MKKVVDIPELIDLNSLIVNTNFFFSPIPLEEENQVSMGK